jgi:hypothetical protein
MSVIINASTTSGLTQTADNSGTLELQSGGTTQLFVSSTGAYGQIKSGTAVASTSGTSIDYTGLPTWAKRITVMFSSVSTNGSSTPIIRIGSGSVQSTGYDSTASCGTNVGAYQSSTSGFLACYQGTTASSILKGTVVLTLLGANTWVANGNVSDSVVGLVNSGSSGNVTLSGTLDRIRITTVNGTDAFDAGSINILYEG